MPQNLPVDQLKANLAEFALWRADYLDGDEKGEAQTFLNRLFQALGHAGPHEAGARFEDRIRNEAGGVSFADLMWKPRVLIEMKKTGARLNRHYRQAFDYWIRAVPDRPQFVVLCNFDELWIYDFDKQLDEPIDRVPLQDLAQRWEALAFMLPDPLPPQFGNDLEAVTREAAGHVAAVFRSLVNRGTLREHAQRFVLQCVMAMFAEDIGLLPRHMYTEALDEAKDGRDAYDRLGGLFREMNAPGLTPGGNYAGTPYFNGGLFREIYALELNRGELLGLRLAAGTNWTDVRPEIFGTIFEQSMDAGERHASGAHFTSQTDIMRIVGPCIVEPWRARIADAKTIQDYGRLLHDLSQYKVLDPACGSGNFLYVAFRELRRLEHEIVELRAARTRGRGADGAQAYIASVIPENFHGIDTNVFAVEMAKVTMMLAKKLAADELGDQGQVLPLDNLDSTIVAADALFSSWPRADVIVGNPPYIGNRKMTDDLGAAYVSRLHSKFGSRGAADFVTYWFPIAHDHLPEGGRAGFVATKSVHQGDGRKASLEHVVENNGVILEAVPMIPWSGDAQVTVSIVNWQKGGVVPPTRVLWQNAGQVRLEVPEITTSLSPEVDMKATKTLQANNGSFFQGQTYGITKAFKIKPAQARAYVRQEPSSAGVIHPILGGDELLKRTDVDDWVVDIPLGNADDAYRAFPKLLKQLEPLAMVPRQAAAQIQRANNEEILAADPKGRTNVHHVRFGETWWRLGYRREEMLKELFPLDRYIALTRTSSELRGPVFSFVDGGLRVSDGVVAFPFADDYSFGIYQSAVHTTWFREKCTTLETRLTYTAKTVGAHFPWPQNPTELSVTRVTKAAAAIVEHRAKSFVLGQSLASQYDVLRRPGRSTLRDLHEALDDAVMVAYGWEPGSDVLAQLMALNHQIADSEGRGEPVSPPGPPDVGITRISSWRFPTPVL